MFFILTLLFLCYIFAILCDRIQEIVKYSPHNAIYKPRTQPETMPGIMPGTSCLHITVLLLTCFETNCSYISELTVQCVLVSSSTL